MPAAKYDVHPGVDLLFHDLGHGLGVDALLHEGTLAL